MLMVKGIPVLAAGALIGLLGFAGQIAIADEQDCTGEDIALVKKLVDKADITLLEAIQTAEHESGGRAIHATLGLGPKPAEIAAKPGDRVNIPVSTAQNPPSYHICCLADGKVVDVFVDSRSGAVLATKESAALPASFRLASSNEFAQTKSVQKSGQTPFRILKASDFMGMPVVNQSGEKLGEIQDLAIDTDQERVAYAVLSFGGFLGMGEKWFAIPATALTLPADRKQFVLAMDKDRLKNAPGFAKDRWPQMGDSTWESGIHEFYDQEPYWMSIGEGSTPTNMNRIQKASDIIGRSVQNNQRENLGSIKDLVIDPDQYRIAYTVLSFGGFMGLGDKLFAMPTSVLQMPSNEKFAVLTVDKNRLKEATGFDKNQWPNLADPTVASGIYEFYGQRPYWTEEQRGRQTDYQHNRP
jgi:sporulation protein YlmC with PRC-barrel domain